MAKIPQTIGKYKVESLIAQGGMGAVYKAVHPTLNRPVIIKKLTLLGKKEINERFKREARILMDFRHDHIVSVYDHFKEGSGYYLVLEYVDGVSLDELCKKNRYINSGVTAAILLDTARALRYAHNKKVVHRDIKPANILISRMGDVKLVDFGIASSDETQAEELTREGMTLGTPGYMAPEQFQDSKNVDLRADIYSLGVLAYEMLTGKKPYPGNYSPELMSSIQMGKYTPPGKIVPGINPLLRKFIRKAMRVRQERRYQNLSEVISLLEKALQAWDPREIKILTAQAVRGAELGIPSRLKRKRKKLFRTVTAAIIVLVLAAGAGIYFLGLYRGIFYTGSYGGVIFSVKTPQSRPALPSGMVSLKIYRDDDREIPLWEGPPVFFFPVKAGSFSGRVSLPVYLPAGAYRSKITAGNEVFWNSFLVEPVNRQNSAAGGTGLERITCYRYDRGQRPLLILPQVRDSLTGEDLTFRAQVLVQEGREWIPLEEALNLITGGVRKIRVGAEGYKEKIFSLRVENEQDVLILQAGLIPGKSSNEEKQ